ncbi:MAG: histidine phosphatase family protein [Paracoccaceae bacterium]|nr:histidine phosphatase family protein [Paracoccaceae bacterium]
MIRLALLRHGHTPWNREGRIQGRTDIALDDAAEKQLSRLVLPEQWQGATLWSSPLKRAIRTAELVSDQRPKTDPALIEMDWGDWEGKEGAILRADPNSGFRDIEEWGWHYRPPNGESPADLRTRLRPWVQSLSGDVVVVCHIGIMRVLMAQATGWDFAGPAPFQIKRNRLFVITVTDRDWSAENASVRLSERTS